MSNMIWFPQTGENELTNNLDDKPITSCLQKITLGVHRKLNPSWGVGVITESFGRFGPHVKLQMTRFFRIFFFPLSYQHIFCFQLFFTIRKWDSREVEKRERVVVVSQRSRVVQKNHFRLKQNTRDLFVRFTVDEKCRVRNLILS